MRSTMPVKQRVITPTTALTTAPDEKLRQGKADKWKEDNREALEELNNFHDEHGCFSDEYRTF
ncbi:antitoxin [Salmonella enterica]|nr:antitoxin [Salmonella enterica]EBF1559328.1 antitoxin [Salmonella enterica]EDU2040190.1 antitoxin [Salmonella enterica subsp. enterica serovar Florida]EKT6407550.1 type II toxin-antitoxin system CcdA family antitoxin [Salmonella enterica]